MSVTAGAARPALAVDHLVVACRTLPAGRAWCEATFGVAAETGGRHAFMATHNALLDISSPRFPRAYLELIAIDPDAAAPSHRRWFDLDTPELQAALDVPRLVHWVARSDDVEAAAAAFRSAGFDPGAVVAAERMTPSGALRWRITVRADGRRPAGGALPTLIEWGSVHPTDSLPQRGVALESLRIAAVAPALVERLGIGPIVAAPAPSAAPASSAAAAPGVAVAASATVPLTAVVVGRRGAVTLAAPS